MLLHNIIKYGAAIGAYIFFNIDIKGKENIPKQGRFILCSNHTSYWDPVLLGMLTPRIIHFMAKKELFKNTLISKILKKSYVIEVKREGNDISAIKESIRALKKESIVALFPQGTRVQTNDSESAKGGIGMLALKTNSPVIPVRLEFKTKFRSKAKIIIGKPITFELKDKKSSSDVYEEIGQEVIQKIYDLE